MSDRPDPDPDADPDPETTGLDMDPSEIDRELDRGDPALSTSLRALLAPPTDIEDRVADQVSEQLIGGSVAGTAFDLLGLGLRTLQTILTDAPGPADRRTGRRVDAHVDHIRTADDTRRPDDESERRVPR